MSWRPKTELEEEIVSQQPGYNFIYGDLTDRELKRTNEYARPRSHLEYLEKKKSNRNENNTAAPSGQSLHLIRKVHQMAGTKQMGAEAKIEDWDTRENVERETIGMIRSCGMGPSIDLPLNKKVTIPTLPVENKIHVVRNGENSFPVIWSDDYFSVESTRMRRAKELNNTTHQLNNLKLENIDNIKPLLSDEPTFETLDEATERKAKEFEEQYPLLEQQKTKLKKKKSEKSASNSNASFSSDATIAQKNILTNSSPNTSIINNSSYFSFTSGSEHDDSVYRSASEFEDSIPKLNSSNTTQSYEKIIHKTEKSNIAKSDTKNHKQFYSPKDVYNLKHLPK